MKMMRDGDGDSKRDALSRIAEAFDRAPVALTLADISVQDSPLVVVNSAFETLTGYHRSEMLGANCRFLQSDLPNDEARAEVRASLAESRGTQVVLLNRRRSGQIFQNLLLLQPLRERTGEIQLILGSQFELKKSYKDEQLDDHIQELDAAVARAIYNQNTLRSEQRRIMTDAAKSVAEAWLAMH